MTQPAKKSVRQALTSGGLLALVALLGTALLSGVHDLTRERIAEQERLAVQRQLNAVLPPADYDNAPYEDRIEIRDPAFFHDDAAVVVYRARRQGQPVAVILDHVAPDGYNGDIHLLTGIRIDGSISGVRVIAHRETPGLGDAIEVERSDWIHDFDHRSLDDPGEEGWAVRRDGGQFDQFTGATITPRAVVEAVQRALQYHRQHRAKLYAPGPAKEDSPHG